MAAVVNPAAVTFDRMASEILAGLVRMRAVEDDIAAALQRGMPVRAVAELLGVGIEVVRRVQRELVA